MWTSGAYGYLSDYLLWWIAPVSLILHAWCFFKLYPKRFATSRLVVGNALMLLCFLSFAGALGESYFRFLVVETDAYGASLASKRWMLLHAQLNSLYFRDKEWTPAKASGVRRIAVIGDSFVFGWGIENTSDRFTDILQARFDASGDKRVEVMNMGWSGWDTAAELRAVPDLLAHAAFAEAIWKAFYAR